MATTALPTAAPGTMLARLSGPLNALLTGGVVRRAEDGTLELLLDAEEAAQGGMAVISMNVPVRCPVCVEGATTACPRCGTARVIEALFSAWLAVRPGVADGTLLSPSAQLPGVVRPVVFRVRRSCSG